MKNNIGNNVLMMAVLMLLSVVAIAQNGDKQKMSREQLAEAQARHIASDEALALDKATAEKFVKTYCEYQKEIWALGPRIPKVTEDMSDAEVAKITEQRFERSQKILMIREKYYKKYAEFLSAKQIEKVYELERLMKRRMAKAKKEGSR